MSLTKCTLSWELAHWMGLDDGAVALLRGWRPAPKDLRPKARMVRVMVASILLVMVACIGSRCDPGFAPIRVGPSTQFFGGPGVPQNAGAQKVGFGKYPSPSPNAAKLIQYAEAMGSLQPPRQTSSFEPAVDQAAMDWNAMHLWPIDFGKFRGTSYNDMYEKHNSYIAWLRSQAEHSEAAASLIFYADSRDGSLSHGERVRVIGQSKVGFGKYRDLTIEELYNKHYFYAQWLCNQKDSGVGSIIKDYSKLMEESLAPGQLAEHIGKQLVGFGKHRKMTIAQLCQHEPDYVTWLRMQPDPRDGLRQLLDCVAFFDREALHTGVVN